MIPLDALTQVLATQVACAGLCFALARAKHRSPRLWVTAGLLTGVGAVLAVLIAPNLGADPRAARRKEAGLAGIGAGLFCCAGALLSYGLSAPDDRLGARLAFLVGVLLVALSVIGLSRRPKPGTASEGRARHRDASARDQSGTEGRAPQSLRVR